MLGALLAQPVNGVGLGEDALALKMRPELVTEFPPGLNFEVALQCLSDDIAFGECPFGKGA